MIIIDFCVFIVTLFLVLRGPRENSPRQWLAWFALIVACITFFSLFLVSLRDMINGT